MSSFCGKCGSPLSPQGLCPNCDPNPNPNFVDGSQVSFEIPKNQGATVYARNSMGDLPNNDPIDSANIPQNAPPVSYEGNMPNTPPMNNVPPMGQQQGGGNTSGQRHQSSPPRRKRRNPKLAGIIAVSVVLVICIIISSVCVMMYNDVMYIPDLSENLKYKVDNKIYGDDREDFIITGEKISSKSIEDEDDALAVAKEFTEELGYDRIADGYTLLKSFSYGGYTYYRFQENYENVPVIGRTMTIIADEDGNSCGVSTNVINIDKNLNTDIGDYDKDEVVDSLKSLKDGGVEVSVNAYTKSIYSFDRVDKPIMTYEVLAVVNNLNFRIFIDPEEGKVINGYCLDSTKSTPLTGNGKDMPNNPQHFDGDLHGELFVTSDPDRNITVYNAEKGTSTIAVEYIDSDNKSYYNRRYNPGDADYTLNDEVCVIYDEEGEYYIYNQDKGIYEKDGVELDIEDLREEGYTVFNLNSDNSLSPVSSKDDRIKDELAVRLAVKTAQTYDFYKNILDREGYDGANGTMMAVCNDNLNDQPENAFCAGDNNGFSMITFGYENPMEWDDVAHEYTHAVEQSISSLIYQNESGAIMEGYSDIFGEIVEDYCYETAMGSKLEDDNLNMSCDWQADDRNMYMPLLNNMPYQYMGAFFSQNNKEEDITETKMGMMNDFGHVHDNSTVISHLACLMVTDKEDEDVDLSMEELSKLWYSTLYLLPSDCTFTAFRDCMELQADRMEANKELTSEKRANISDCFDKVNIPTTRYSREVKLVVRSDKANGSYKIKIDGKPYKFIKFKDFSQEIELTDGEKIEDGVYEYSETIKLDDGKYSIRVQEKDDKTNYFDRDIIVWSSDDSMLRYNNENSDVEFYFKKLEADETE